MLLARDIRAVHGGKMLLTGAALTLEPGQVKGLVAPNGWGKTTLLTLLAGARLQGCAGELVVDGVRPRDEVAFRRAVFYAPGEGTLLCPDATARFHLEATRRLWDSPVRVGEHAERCGIEGFLGRPVRTLSQGMKQQLTLAIAFMTGARYLLLDEPMNALDPTNVQRNSRLVRQAAADGRAVIMSSHILDNVDRVCDSVLFVRDGGLVEVPCGGAGSLAMYNELYGEVERGSAVDDAPPRHRPPRFREPGAGAAGRPDNAAAVPRPRGRHLRKD